MTLAPSDGSWDFRRAFEEAYKYEFGFLLEGLDVMVDDVRVRGIGKTRGDLGETVYAEVARLKFTTVSSDKSEGTKSMYFDSGRVDAPVYLLEKLQPAEMVKGPAAIVDGTQTLILDPSSEAKITSKHVFITLS